MRDGDVLQRDVELRCALHQIRANAVRHGLTLGDELGGVELSDDGFEDFVADGGEDSFVVVSAVGLVSLALLFLVHAFHSNST